MVTRSLILVLALACAQAHAETFTHWIASYGYTGADAAATADPDHDGVPNLMEYALAGMQPNVMDANHASMPHTSFVRRTGTALGAWEWTDSQTPPTNGLNGKWHFAFRFIPRAEVESIRYTPQLGDTSSLRRWFDGRSAIFCELFPGNIIQATAITLGNRHKRMFMRLKVEEDATVDGSLAGIHVHSLAPQALIVGTPVSVPRAITAPSTSSLQTEDRLILRTTGATTLSDFTWSWTAAPTNINPVVLTRESSNSSVISPHPTDPYLWVCGSAGTATLKLKTESSTYTASVTTATTTGATTDVITGYATGSLRKHISDAIDTKLAGKTASSALPIFTTQDHANATYVRNANCWGADYVSALTALSPWNSVGGAQYAGILISPRHVLFATHWSAPAGATIRFVTTDNTVVTRTISSIQALTQSQFLYPDLTIGKLDSDVPGTIAFARVLPSFTAKLPSLASYPVVCAATDQEEKLLVREVTSIPTSTSPYALVTFRAPSDATRSAFYEDVVGGDSSNPAFMIINGQLVVLTCWTYGGAGSGSSVFAFKSAINTAMTSLGGGYTLTDADLSGFTSY